MSLGQDRTIDEENLTRERASGQVFATELPPRSSLVGPTVLMSVAGTATFGLALTIPFIHGDGPCTAPDPDDFCPPEARDGRDPMRLVLGGVVALTTATLVAGIVWFVSRRVARRRAHARLSTHGWLDDLSIFRF
ncbi:MAG: hypothetical protein MUE69_23060 [Myxococcota bacterium]|nr:hypothetical protein [Myxococcota bacterium]